MPVTVSKKLPAIKILKQENIFVMDELRARQQDIRPLRIVILNLMPLKISTETDLLRLLSNSPLQIKIDFLKINGHKPKNTSMKHMKMFYKNFEEINKKKYDGMIITGAPVEKLPFTEVTYWGEIKKIFTWAQHNVYSSMFICWAAQAGLYYYYGIQKKILQEKISGVFKHTHINSNIPILRGFDDIFYMPHSRYTNLETAEIKKVKKLQIIAQSKEAGAAIIKANNGRQLFITGHPEYSRYTLKNEYKRDKGKRLQIDIPYNYFPEDNPSKKPVMKWKSSANLLFSNWLNYYLYQKTPYNIEKIK